ncbi:MAG: RsmB/NOP family class I SAM-dependent RNA methyltransferase [Candidatus Nucleicultricaceae bacterium]
MRPSAHYQTILELLPEIHNPKVSLDTFLERYFRSRRFMGSGDRKAISTGLYDIIRNWAYINTSLKNIASSFKTDRAPLIAFMILVKKLPKSDFNTYFNGDQYGLLPLDPEESRMAQALYDIPCTLEERPLEIQANIPTWMADPSLYGDVFRSHLKDELEALNSPASVDLRVNTLKTSRDALLKILKNLYPSARLIPLTRNGIRLDGRTALHALKEFKDGHFEIQDAGSQLIAQRIQQSNPQHILDYCAGAGGKTLYLAEMLNKTGKITATDIAAHRLDEAKKRADRAGAKNIAFIPFTHFHATSPHNGHYDCVVVDAPCTGSGTLRRKPELRWRLTPEDIKVMSTLQLDVIKDASTFVKQGGELVYITCSLFRAENENVVQNFLEHHPDFHLLECTEKASHLHRDAPSFKGPFIHLSPYSTETDGFFAAFLKRRN